METKLIQRLQVWTMSAILALADRIATAATPETDDDRGDVPGWVMITVMTAIGGLSGTRRSGSAAARAADGVRHPGCRTRSPILHRSSRPMPANPLC